MQTFTIGLGRTWWIRLVGRNPLVRCSDRIEAWAAALAVLIIAVATPAVGAIGTSVHGARTQHYAEEANSRQQVVATAMEDTTVVMLPTHVEFEVRAIWKAAGRVHDEIIEWPGEAKSGERRAIWVDDEGDMPCRRHRQVALPVTPSASPCRAGSELSPSSPALCR